MITAEQRRSVRLYLLEHPFEARYQLAVWLVEKAVAEPDGPVAALVALRPIMSFVRDMICPQIEISKPQPLLTA